MVLAIVSYLTLSYSLPECSWVVISNATTLFDVNSTPCSNCSLHCSNSYSEDFSGDGSAFEQQENLCVPIRKEFSSYRLVFPYPWCTDTKCTPEKTAGSERCFDAPVFKKKAQAAETQPRRANRPNEAEIVGISIGAGVGAVLLVSLISYCVKRNRV